MKKVLLISASPAAGGKGDKIVDALREGAASAMAEVSSVYLRNVPLSPCRACNGCAKDGVCVQGDGMREIIAAMHGSDAVMFVVPVYYNYMAAQAVIFLDRLYCTYRCANYKCGPKKKVCVFLTCEGSEKEPLKKQIEGIMSLGSIARSVSVYRTEVYRGCEDDFYSFLQTARETGEWAAK